MKRKRKKPMMIGRKVSFIMINNCLISILLSYPTFIIIAILLDIGKL